MSDKKISQLTALTGANAAADDQLAIVDTNVAETKKISRAEFFKNTPDIGIGTSSPNALLSVGASYGGTPNIQSAAVIQSTSNTYFTIGAGTSGDSGILFADSADNDVGFVGYNHSTNAMTFGANAGERMRIDSSGNLLVGTTSNPSSTKVFIDGSSIVGLSLSRSTTDPAGQVVFRNPNGAVGEIYTTGSSTVYATSSDYRLKENIAPMTGALAKVAALKPCTYTWKVDGSDGQGFIAHELAEVLSDAVVGEKDAVDEEGNPKYQGVDTSFLVATLTAAIQELKAELDTVKAELNQIKGA
jgi:hypothetical protein